MFDRKFLYLQIIVMSGHSVYIVLTILHFHCFTVSLLQFDTIHNSIYPQE